MSKIKTDHKIRNGFRVFGPNIADHSLSSWYFPTLEEAENFAKHIAGELNAEYDILQYIGTYRQKPVKPRPVEFIQAESIHDR